MAKLKTCSKCGEANASTDRHCFACGANLGDTKPSSDQDAVDIARQHPKKRPGCITAFAVWLFLSGIGTLIRAVPAIAIITQDLASIRERGDTFSIIMTVSYSLDALLSLLTAWGLWQMKNWARILTIVELSLAILICFVLNPGLGAVALLIFGYVVYWMASHGELFGQSGWTLPPIRISRRATILVLAVASVVGLGASIAVAVPLLRSQLLDPEPCTWSDGVLESTGCLHILEANNKDVRHLQMSSDGAVLVSASSSTVVSGNQVVELWDVSKGKRLSRIEVDRYASVDQIALAPDGTILALPLNGGTQVQLWRVGDGEALHTLHIDDSSSSINLIFSPDAKTLAVSDEEQIKLWRVADGMLLGTISDFVFPSSNSLAFSPDGVLLAVGNLLGTVQLWDTTDSTLLSTLTTNGNTLVEAVAFSPDGKLLASWGHGESINLLEISSGRFVRTLARSSSSSPPEPLIFSPDGRLLTTMMSSGRVQVWNVQSGKQVYSPTADTVDDVCSLAFTQDGLIAALSSGGFEDATIWLWRIQDYEGLIGQDD